MLDKKQIQAILLFKFKLGGKAVEKFREVFSSELKRLT